MTARTLGIAAIAALTMSALLGCGREPGDGSLDKGEGTAAPIASQAPQAPAAAVPLIQDAFDVAPGGQVELKPPFGWVKQVRGTWIAFESPDRLSVMALTEVGPKEKVPVRLLEGAGELGLTELHLQDEQPIAMGLEPIPARATDGNGKLAAGDARVEYAVLETEGGKRTMILRATAKSAPEAADKAALTALTTVRRTAAK